MVVIPSNDTVAAPGVVAVVVRGSQNSCQEEGALRLLGVLGLLGGAMEDSWSLSGEAKHWAGVEGPRRETQPGLRSINWSFTPTPEGPVGWVSAGLKPVQGAGGP